MKKIIGILGGMGPEATADLFMKIIRSTPAQKDQDHIRVVIDSNPLIPDRTAFSSGKGEDPRPLLVATAKNLERMGASFIAIPCNTAHYFHKDIQDQVGIPVLHIMEEVAQYLSAKRESGRVNRAGLLASTGTVKTHLYETALARKGIETLVPDPGDQERVMVAIYLVKAGKLDEARGIVLEEGRHLIEKGADVIIAGCTEIPLVLKDGDLSVRVLDATMVLAEACVKLALRG